VFGLPSLLGARADDRERLPRARLEARKNAAASTMAVGPWQIVVTALVILLLFLASRLERKA
jgi:hypothetical protein